MHPPIEAKTPPIKKAKHVTMVALMRQKISSLSAQIEALQRTRDTFINSLATLDENPELASAIETVREEK